MITANNETYKDDFIASGVDSKNYLRILFNGGRSVQIRELNQIQSILQNQIDKFGSSIYKEGVAVLGGGAIFDKKIYAIQFATADLAAVDLTTAKSLHRGTGDTQVFANIIGYDTDATNTIFYIRYASSGGEDASNNFFNTALSITITYVDEFDVDQTVAVIPNDTQSIFGGAFLEEGVFYTNGCFVVTPKQQIFIPIVDEINGLNGSVVLQVTEDYVSHLDDSTLLDNANGTLNHLAPGADRYRITLTLAYVDIGDVVADDQILLLDIINSKVSSNSKSKYRELDRILAQRTSEESGDYILNPFKIEIEELENSSRPGSDELDAADKFYVGLDPSVAYVDGYRVELSDKLDMVGNKARETFAKDIDLGLAIGSYVTGVPVAGSDIPNINQYDYKYNLYDGEAGAGVLLGTCRIRAVETIGTSFRLFIYDITLLAGKNILDAESLTGNYVSFNIDGLAGSLRDAANVSSVFKLPFSTVESIDDVGFSYIIQKYLTMNDAGAGNYNYTLGSNEEFIDSTAGNYIVDYGAAAAETWQAVTAYTPVVSGLNSETLTISGGSIVAGNSMRVIAPVRVTTVPSATKTIVSVVDEVRTVYVGNLITLAHADIIAITQVKRTSDDLDITVDYVLDDDGQRSNYYTNGKIKYIGGGVIPVSIKVTYTRYSHSGLPFTANSYSTTAYADIPKYDGYSLADCVDFRPIMLNIASPASTASIQPDPFSVLTATPSFYLPRIDKLVVTSNSEFKFIEGVPAVYPVAPATPPSSLALYELNIPAYTFAAQDIDIKFIDNRRYTMRDIGGLDKRIDKLEYYTSLSLLEKSASERTIADIDGDRFKNGILVDAFTGHGVGNVFDSGYACSIDADKGTLRPMFTTEGIDLILSSTHSGVTPLRVNENTVTLQYTETPLLNQKFSSEDISVNPYDVASFVGNVSLYPAVDKWMETKRRPAIIINNKGANDAIKYIANESGALGTDWNSWQTKWSGITDTEKLSRPHSVMDPAVGKLRLLTENTVTNVQEQTGIKTKIGSKTVTKNQGDRIVDLSFVPFMRSRRVYFSAKGLKPRTRVYPFFDGVAINAYCKSEAVLQNRNIAGAVVEDYFDDTSLTGNGPLITNVNGSITGSFIVPNNSALKFRTGERAFKLTDSPTNNIDEATTFAEANYTASGSVETKQATIVSTRVPVIKKERVTRRRTTTDTVLRYVDPLAQTFLINDIQEGVFLTSIDIWFASKSTTGIPVTLRIVEVENGYPTQSVLPFSEVSLTPDLITQLWVDGESAAANNARSTRFTFGDPVYLKSGVEYAFVILSNDPAYHIRVARLGGKDESNKIIQTNPYGGVMFTSQNASTWTADQSRDIKFRINRAEFTPGEVGGFATFRSFLTSGLTAIDPASSFTIMQGASAQKECTILNQLLYGSDTYSNLEVGDTYIPNTPLDITTSSHATLKTTLKTSSKYVSPIIDLDGISLVTIHNLINNSVVDEVDGTGAALARYITREVELNDPADQLNIYLDVMRPKNDTNISVYVKLKTDSTTYTDWELLDSVAAIKISENTDDYTEVTYIKDSSGDDFLAFALKIVFTSPSIINTCTVKNLRVIATS